MTPKRCIARGECPPPTWFEKEFLPRSEFELSTRWLTRGPVGNSAGSLA
jgi:hypothetical protein